MTTRHEDTVRQGLGSTGTLADRQRARVALDALLAERDDFKAKLRRRIDDCGCGYEDDGTLCVFCVEDLAALKEQP